ncbi:RBBP9/YdeN family alpha/beta hydrolase [Terrimonas pollutisoli]|uniref:RBBP9/YdeN family alpha/beta hydrolase n=1 Tax=Terrimonas pollutisoli TaxID=3034147 RepID=UPI0023ED19D0|nr:alpha/beta hydrolase [Terrimonas sp. H1YJ31]
MTSKYKEHIFTVPGLYSSGPDHWQTHWEKEFGIARIEQKDWETPVCNDWIQTIDSVVNRHPLDKVILIGHSLACCTIVRWAEKYQRIIKGALLAGPSDVEAPSYPPGTTGFSPMPVFHMPFPSIVIASSNDEYVTMERAKEFAKNWGSELVNAGELGHINSSSGLGKWPFGLSYLERLVQK